VNISMYQASVPIFTRILNNLSAILQKAAEYAEARKIDPAVLINSRLYPDMFAFARQVQIATDTAKGAASRLAGLEPPKYEDNEASLPELDARIRKTVAFLEGFTPTQIDGSEERVITLKSHDKEVSYPGLYYLMNSALPNFFFHVTTAYDILRHNGVEIGKKDFLGPLKPL